MQVRFPTFDSTKFRPHWAPNPEFAQSYNSFSIVPAHIEPYLVKVMMRARKALPAGNDKLDEEMGVFIRQETQHYKQHAAFNEFMYKAGYDGMKQIEEEYKADYVDFLANKSLKFNLAYCEGFEVLGCTAGEVWFSGEIDTLLEGCDPYAVDLWKWHLAEEFEHRTVCFDVFHTFHGRGFWNAIVNGYFYRIAALFYAMRHINGYTRRCTQYLLAKDREGMTPEQLEQSKAREKAMSKIIAKATLKRVGKALLPNYNPAKKRMPPNMRALLARYEQPSPAAAA